jgi:hypothetical protein
MLRTVICISCLLAMVGLEDAHAQPKPKTDAMQEKPQIKPERTPKKPEPTLERWGVRPIAEEEPEYREKTRQLERELHQVQSRLNQTRNNMEALWGEWSVEDKAWAEHQFFTSGKYGPAQGAGVSMAEEEWNEAVRSYETAVSGAGTVDLNDPLVGAAARDQLWGGHLRVLRKELVYFNTRLAYENIRYNAIKEQLQTRYGEWNSLVNDAIDHAEYAYWSFSDAVVTELFNCTAKTIANSVRNALLNMWGPYRQVMMTDSPVPEPIYRLRLSPGADGGKWWNPKITLSDPVAGAVPLGDFYFLDCIRDGFRAGLVASIVAGFRKGFVDMVARRGSVHPQVAEYWWSRFVWDGPIEDPYTHIVTPRKGNPNYLLRKLEDAFYKNWVLEGEGTNPYIEQAREQLKEYLGGKQAKKLSPAYQEAVREAQRIFDDGVRGGALRPEQVEKMRKELDGSAREIYSRKESKQYTAKAAVEVAEYVFTLSDQAITWVKIGERIASFEQQEQVLFKSHEEIVKCLVKMEISPTPHEIIAIYELTKGGREGIDNFFRQCRQPSRAEREKVLEQLKNIDAQIVSLLDEASGQVAVAREQCDAALAACGAAVRSYNATAADAGRQKAARAAAGTKMAELQARVTALAQQAEKAAQAGQAMGQSMVGAEKAALAACEGLKRFAGLKSDIERKGLLGRVKSDAAQAASRQQSCAQQGVLLRQLAGQTQSGATGVAADADALASTLGGGAAAADDGDADLERCRGSLGAARNASNSLPDLEQRALGLHAEAERIAKPMRGDREIEAQMDTLWRHVEPITVFARGPGDCLPKAAQQLKAAEGARARAQTALADTGQGSKAPVNPGALKQAAAAAAQKAENAGALADDYRSRADTASADAQNCVNIAEDLARQTAVAASAASPATGGTGTAAQPAVDCSWLSGSSPAFDGRSGWGCACPAGMGANRGMNACISCVDYENNFAAAINSGDLNNASAWLAEGANCPWHGRAQAALQSAYQCRDIEQQILGAARANNYQTALALLDQAKAMGCPVNSQAEQALRQSAAAHQQQQGMQAQMAMEQFLRNMQSMMSGMQGGGVRPPTPIPQTRPGGGAIGPQAGMAAQTQSRPQGRYSPRGSGPACSSQAQSYISQCKQASAECSRRNCGPSGAGYSGCGVDCPGCGGGEIAMWFTDYWCQISPAYASQAHSAVSAYISEIRSCQSRFLSDRQAGRRERGADCQRAALGKLDGAFKNAVAQACSARCAQDGRRGTIGYQPHTCYCE